MIDIFKVLIARAHAALSGILERIEAILRISSETVPSVLLVVFVILVLAAFAISWQRRNGVRPLLLVGAIASIPFTVIVVILSLEAMRGSPDDHCGSYQNGKMNVRLYSVTVVKQDVFNQFAGRWFILLVRADRWGNEPHQCRVDANGKVGRFLKKVVFKDREPAEGDMMSFDGSLFMSFGNEQEEPNVTFKGIKAGTKPYKSELEEQESASPPRQ